MQEELVAHPFTANTILSQIWNIKNAKSAWNNLTTFVMEILYCSATWLAPRVHLFCNFKLALRSRQRSETRPKTTQMGEFRKIERERRYVRTCTAMYTQKTSHVAKKDTDQGCQCDRLWCHITGMKLKMSQRIQIYFIRIFQVWVWNLFYWYSYKLVSY